MKFHRPMIKSGDKRTVTRFAFLPERIDDNTVVWLERIRITEEYVDSVMRSGWRPIKWERVKSCL